MNVVVGLRAKNARHKEFNDAIDEREKALLRNRKEYKASEWCREMTKQAVRDGQKKGGYKASGCFIKELDKVGAFKKIPGHAKKELETELKKRR